MEEILHHIGVGQLCEKFTKEGIDLMLLKSMTADDLKDLVPQVGPRIRLRNYLATVVVEFESEKLTASVNNYESTANESLSKSECFDMTNFEGITKSVSKASTDILDASINCTKINIDTCRDDHQITKRIIIKVNEEISDGAEIRNNEEIENNLHETSSQPLQKKLTAERRRFFLHSDTLLDYIKKNGKSFAIWNNYQSSKTLSNTDRARLVDAIINGVLDRHCSVKKEMLQDISEDFVQIFPTEDKSVYFSYDKNVSKNAQGKLPYKYHNEKSRRKLNESQDEKVSTCSPTLDQDLLDKKEWLKFNNDPWDKVTMYWKDTHEIRILGSHMEGPVFNYIENWPILKNTKAHLLVSINNKNIFNV